MYTKALTGKLCFDAEPFSKVKLLKFLNFILNFIIIFFLKPYLKWFLK